MSLVCVLRWKGLVWFHVAFSKEAAFEEGSVLLWNENCCFSKPKRENQAAIGSTAHQTIDVFTPALLARYSVNTGVGKRYLLMQAVVHSGKI